MKGDDIVKKVNGIVNGLDSEIERLISGLSKESGELRSRTVEEIDRLSGIRTKYRDETTHSLSHADWLYAGVTVVSLLAILKQERLDVISSKGFNILSRMIK